MLGRVAGDRADSVFDELVERLVGATAIVPVGPASELRTACGPLIDADAYERVQRYRSLAHEEGDVVVERTDVPERRVVRRTDPSSSPTTRGSRIATDEIFGPVLTMLRARRLRPRARARERHRLRAHRRPLLTLSVADHPGDSHALRAGNVYVNRGITGALVGRQPFGGYGLSGVGSKAGGPDYLLQFVEPRVVTENTVRQGFAPQDER